MRGLLTLFYKGRRGARCVCEVTMANGTRLGGEGMLGDSGWDGLCPHVVFRHSVIHSLEWTHSSRGVHTGHPPERGSEARKSILGRKMGEHGWSHPSHPQQVQLDGSDSTPSHLRSCEEPIEECRAGWCHCRRISKSVLTDIKINHLQTLVLKYPPFTFLRNDPCKEQVPGQTQLQASQQEKMAH